MNSPISIEITKETSPKNGVSQPVSVAVLQWFLVRDFVGKRHREPEARPRKAGGRAVPRAVVSTIFSKWQPGLAIHSRGSSAPAGRPVEGDLAPNGLTALYHRPASPPSTQCD